MTYHVGRRRDFSIPDWSCPLPFIQLLLSIFNVLHVCWGSPHLAFFHFASDGVGDSPFVFGICSRRSSDVSISASAGYLTRACPAIFFVVLHKPSVPLLHGLAWYFCAATWYGTASFGRNFTDGCSREVFCSRPRFSAGALSIFTISSVEKLFLCFGSFIKKIGIALLTSFVWLHSSLWQQVLQAIENLHLQMSSWRDSQRLPCPSRS